VVDAYRRREVTRVVRGSDGVVRCFWAGDDPLYQRYHDEEWGVPTHDDHRLFEKICLEGFQSGLSWITILRKRENFRRAFRDFDFARVARFTSRDVNRLLKDAGIVRHRGKIESTINNAKRALELKRECGSLDAYFWRWNDPKELARDLKSRGWTFVGPTTVYAFMQAMGIVNDHAEGCWRRSPAESSSSRRRGPSGQSSGRSGASSDKR
jgi:DNA-3-methyladenine glycosylase I